MATVFMRWLERHPAAYERGIRLLTLGRLEDLYSSIAEQIHPGMRILEIGCGTGALTRRLAERTDRIDAIDISADMLEVAQEKLQQDDLIDRVQLQRMDALALATHFQTGQFDVIVSSLAFSELSAPAQEHVMRISHHLLKAGGVLFILDEVQPSSPFSRFISALIRTPLRLITWLLTRTTTQPIKDVADKLSRSGFRVRPLRITLGGLLCVYEAIAVASSSPEHAHEQIVRLSHRTSSTTILRDAWALFFRVLPPYPKFEPGLYALGKPNTESPVLVTGNYDLTVRRVIKQTAGNLDAWLLVVNSSGVNVWCGAGGGFLTAERVIGALEMSGVRQWHATQHLILPQLCANGVDGQEIRQQTGWRVSWGPVLASDIPAYLKNGCMKTDAMRTVAFPALDRLEMVSATLGLYGLMILIPVLLFWRYLFWPVFSALLGLSYFYAITLPLIPGRDGLRKSIPLAVIALVGLFVYSMLTGLPEAPQFFRRGIGVVALSVFVAAEMQGMSPLMRGEQANWGWEALIALVLGGTYWLVPALLGWSG